MSSPDGSVSPNPVVARLDALLILELSSHLGAAPLGLRGVALEAALRLNGLAPVLGRLLALTRQVHECWEYNVERLEEDPPTELLGVEDPRVGALGRLALELNLDLSELDAASASAAVVLDVLDPWVVSTEGAHTLARIWCALTLALCCQLELSPSRVLDRLWPDELGVLDPDAPLPSES